MIRVDLQPEYDGFDAKVRQPGQAFLQDNPSPSSKEFKKKNYWTRSLPELMAAYDKRCAYTSRKLVETGSVDHFRPKCNYPHLAYEWGNFRLSRQRINSRKGNSEELLDPCAICDGWFVLDLPSCLVRPAAGLSREHRVGVNKTISTLGLNQDEQLVEERFELLCALGSEHITLTYLDSFFPFLSREVRRQDILDELPTLLSL